MVIWLYLVDRIGRRHAQASGYLLSGAMALLLGLGMGSVSNTVPDTFPYQPGLSPPTSLVLPAFMPLHDRLTWPVPADYRYSWTVGSDGS